MALDGKMGEGVVALGELCESAFCYCNRILENNQRTKGEGLFGLTVVLVSVGWTVLTVFGSVMRQHNMTARLSLVCEVFSSFIKR